MSQQSSPSLLGILARLTIDLYDTIGRSSKLVVSGAVAASLSVSTDSWVASYYVVAALGNAVLGKINYR